MFKQTSVETVPLTPELALEFATMPSLPGERALKPSRLNWIERLITDHRFLSPVWYKGIETDTGNLFRLDGQHSSRKLTDLHERSAEMFPRGLEVTIHTIEFEKSERAEVFDFFNNPKSVRDNTDAMGIYRAEHEDITSLSREFLCKVGNGLAAFNSDLDEGEVFSPRQRGLYWQREVNRQFALWVGAFSDAVNGWMLGQSGIVAEMYADYIRSMPLATEFWGYVIHENHPDAADETRELSRVLKEWHYRADKSQREFRKRVATVWKRFARLRQLERERTAQVLPLREFTPAPAA